MTLAKVKQSLQTPTEADNGCQQMIREAQVELGAFYAAVRQRYCEAAALIAAGLWLEEFTSYSAGLPPPWRSITVAASSGLAQYLGFLRKSRCVSMSAVSQTSSDFYPSNMSTQSPETTIASQT